MRVSKLIGATSALITIASLPLAAQTEKGAGPHPTVRGETSSTLQTGQQRLSEYLAGKVYSADGTELGEVEDVIVQSDRIVGAIIEIEDQLAIGERTVAVSIGQLRRVDDRLVLDLSVEQLRALPAFRD